MAAALVDASAMVAVFGARQLKARHYTELLQIAAIERWSLSTTWPCVVETSHLLAPPGRYTFLRWVGAGALAVFPFAQEALNDLVATMDRHTSLPRAEMDLADASLYQLALDTGVTRIMTLDERDFLRYRLPDGRAFEIL